MGNYHKNIISFQPFFNDTIRNTIYGVLMNKAILTIIVFSLAVYSCENPASEKTTLKDILPGTWKNDALDCKITMIFMVSGDDVILDGNVYQGRFTDSTFQGNCNKGNIKCSLSIKMITEKYITGNNEIDNGTKESKIIINAVKQ